MLLFLGLAFLLLPLLELYVIFTVGHWIGLWPTLGILVADSILGALLVRHQGRAAWRRLNEALGAGRLPHREVLEGALVLVGGVLLLTPGFVTDAAGLLLLLPPSRRAGMKLSSVLLLWRFRNFGPGPIRLGHFYGAARWTRSRRRRRSPRPEDGRIGDVPAIDVVAGDEIQLSAQAPTGRR